MSASLIQVIAELTAAASVAILVVAAIRKPLRRIGGARVAYLSWLLVPASQLVVALPAPSRPLEAASQTLPELVRSALPAAMTSDVVIASTHYAVTNYAAIGAIVWAAGGLLMLLFVIRRQRAFVRSLGAMTPMPDGTHRSSTVRSPLLVGAWRPRIVLPTDFESLYDTEERALVLAHEQAHRERGDALVSVIATLWLCLCWFNPLMYWAIARLRFDQELACDAVVLAPRTTLRRRYADALLRTQLAAESGWQLPIGCHWQSSHPLKERIAMLKHPLPTTMRRLSAAVLTCALMISASYAVWTVLPGPAYAQPSSDQITVISGDNQTIVITGNNMRLADATADALATITADFKLRLGKGNNDFEITLITPASVTLKTTSNTLSTLTADRSLRLANGEVEMSGNVILKLLPRGPDDSILLDSVRITSEGGVLTTDRATIEKDGTIRMASALLTPASQP